MDRRALASGCAAGFAFSANYTNHAPMLAVLRAQFHFDQTSAGLLTTGVFLTHALMQTPGGRLADRFGPIRMMGAALAWVAFANFAIAFSGAWWQLFFWKLFAGIGTGACFTSGAKYIVGEFQGSDLHVAQGFYGGSIVLGSGFVLFAAPQLVGAFGWRGAFISCALLCAAVLVWWLAAAPRPSRMPPATGSFFEMLRRGQLWLLGITQMAAFGLVMVVGAWITTLLRESFGMPLKTAGLMGSVVLLLGMISRPLGGSLAPRVPIRTLVGGSLLLNALACAVLGASPALPFAFAAIVALGFGCGVPYACVFNRAAALYPKSAGAAMGLVNMIGAAMILAGAPLVGYLADFTGNFHAGFYALAAFSVLAASAALALPQQT